MKKYDVCIIGGGAAGLAAAASLDKNIKTCLIEKNKILGRKIMATGGGRCNITNAACSCKDLTLDFFKSLGMELYSDSEGRFYPYSNQASDVVMVLEEGVKAQEADIYKGFDVKNIEAGDDFFTVTDGKKTIKAQRLIIATGGKSAPELGTTGDGYIFARKLGHKVNKVYPILTAIECGDFEDIKGIRAKGTVSLYKDGVFIDSETGEIQFNKDGISGICVMNLTLHIKSEENETIKEALGRYDLKLDLAPDFSKEELLKRESTFGILSKKLSDKVGLDKIKEWQLPVNGVKGWKNAQCTAGGVELSQIDEMTMESKMIRGLYFIGEVLDFQGKCGGFNLQNAWEGGIKVAAHLNRILI